MPDIETSENATPSASHFLNLLISDYLKSVLSFYLPPQYISALIILLKQVSPLP